MSEFNRKRAIRHLRQLRISMGEILPAVDELQTLYAAENVRGALLRIDRAIEELDRDHKIHADHPDPVGEFHRQKGCCDGTDPSGCWRRQQEAEAEANRLEREKRRAARANPAAEYDGTD